MGTPRHNCFNRMSNQCVLLRSTHCCTLHSKSNLIRTTTNNSYNLGKSDYCTSQTRTRRTADMNARNTLHNCRRYLQCRLWNNGSIIIYGFSAGTLASPRIDAILMGCVDDSCNTIRQIIHCTGATHKRSANSLSMRNTMSIMSVGSFKRAAGNIH